VEQRVTFCRICEALCGLVATVEDGRVVRLRPDRDHPVSRGYACPKGIAMADVQNHPDRVLHPLRRRAGGFERVGWDEALDDIAGRLSALRDRHGPAAIAWYMGNPAAFSAPHAVWIKGFMDALGSPSLFTAGSQDCNSRFAASALLYGSPLLVPIPDLRRTRLLVVVGANPLVSHGSFLTAPRIREALRAIVARGGRVVVIDPRRTETARAFEHMPIRPDTDAWLMLSLLHVVFADGLEDGAALAAATGGAELRRAVASYPPEATEPRTGVPAAAVRQLARDLAGADAAAVYGRTGTCLGRFGTLVAFLMDALNLAAGRLDRPGGAVFGHSPLMAEEVARLTAGASYARRRSPVGGFPDVMGSQPASLMADQIVGGPIRALLVSAGNPVVSVPDGGTLERALDELDLCVSLDIQVNETNRRADYVLPATTFLERSDLPAAFLTFQATPHLQYSEPVVPPAGEAREEWSVIDDLARRMGVVPSSVRFARWLGRAGLRPRPETTLDLLLRLGPDGDRFGLRRGGLSIRALRRMPQGAVLRDELSTGVLRRRLRHRDRRVHLAPPEIVAELERLAAAGEDAEHRLRLIGMRELRSHNSWMLGGHRQALRVHPADAQASGVADGEVARIVSRHGAIEVPVVVTGEVGVGTVALPHGRAAANGNLLASRDARDLERLAGMANLNGIPVRIEPAG
jgi:anaerobic selenocysteine-containing dehydrogenase